jgi:hypothetical protein
MVSLVLLVAKLCAYFRWSLPPNLFHLVGPFVLTVVGYTSITYVTLVRNKALSFTTRGEGGRERVNVAEKTYRSC